MRARRGRSCDRGRAGERREARHRCLHFSRGNQARDREVGPPPTDLVCGDPPRLAQYPGGDRTDGWGGIVPHQTIRMTDAVFFDAANAAATTVDFATTMAVIRAVAGALGAVHALKLVHRDVKPSNIVLEVETGRPVLIDFGLARRRSASSPRLSIAAGTPTYMAP